jgi:hypothetical protein
MVPAAGVTTTAASAITNTTATAGGNVICGGNAPVTARGICWGTTANPTTAGLHTTDGSGMGSFTSQITGLSANTIYHIRAYATNAQGTFYGSDLTFSTPCGVVTIYPWNEGFENGGLIPNCWSQQQVNSSGVNWTFITGSGNGHPASAHGGTYNACLKDGNAADNKTKLITPPLNLAGLPLPTLKFWHTQAVWYSDQDKLSVYYRTSATGTWTLLTTYSSSITTWTQETITLPNTTADYYIAFEGNAKWGYGVCVDDVQVASACAIINPVSIQISASANPVSTGTQVTFTSEVQNEGTTPVYQWKKNGVAINGATSADYTDIPVNSDTYQCILTSSTVCVSGNPATSNTVTMQVETAPVNREIINEVVIPGQNLCYDALQNIVVAGNDHFFTIQPGGQATLIAGVSILFLPGTSVLNNGRMLAYIAPSGPYCNQTDAPTGITGKRHPGLGSGSEGCFAYPNPTTGNFTVTLPGNTPDNQDKLCIFNLFGAVVKEYGPGINYPLGISLDHAPDGLYLIAIVHGNERITCRIFKQR